jgi:hypothetical protein
VLGSENLFNRIAESFLAFITHIINQYAGGLQIGIYLLIFITFGYALIKIYCALKVLVYCNYKKILFHGGLYDTQPNPKTPLSVIAAGLFARAKMHYLETEKKSPSKGAIPPDAFVRNAAFQFSERYFESKFLMPTSMLASLLPPLGFIGTIMGMVIHFLSGAGDLNSGLTIVGIATALYTTFIGLILYTIMETLKRYFYALAHKRINEGLDAVSGLEIPRGTET